MDTKIQIFRNSTDTLNLSAGEVIFNTGDAGDSMYVIVEGEVQIVLNGKEVERLSEGDLFGELALIDPENLRGATAIAVNDVRLAKIDEKRFTYMVQQTPRFSIQVMRVIAARLRHMNSLFRP